MIDRDLKKVGEARKALREIPCADLLEKVKRAADLFMTATLPIGDDTQTPDAFALITVHRTLDHALQLGDLLASLLQSRPIARGGTSPVRPPAIQ